VQRVSGNSTRPSAICERRSFVQGVRFHNAQPLSMGSRTEGSGGAWFQGHCTGLPEVIHDPEISRSLPSDGLDLASLTNAQTTHTYLWTVLFVEVGIDNIGQREFLFPRGAIPATVAAIVFWVGDSRRSREQTAYNWIRLNL
jgi:hypothetical protein